MNVKILGAGIAGLTAAINLAKKGFNVEVHEKNSSLDKKTNNLQFLENWTTKEDVLSYLEFLHVKTDFYYKPWHSNEFISPTLKKYSGHSKKPLMYLVKRGSVKGSIDASLAKQAASMGVNIKYDSSMKSEEADIVDDGVHAPSFIAIGVKFKLEHDDYFAILLNNNISYKFYSYFIVNDGVGEVVVINPEGTDGLSSRLKLAVETFESLLKIDIPSKNKEFSATLSFDLPDTAKTNNCLFVGEAAGFQDALAGFGMLYAFQSGHAAAKSIIEEKNYDELWKKGFLDMMSISHENRRLFEGLNNRSFENIISLLDSDNFIIRKLRGGNDFRLIMKKLYTRKIAKILNIFL